MKIRLTILFAFVFTCSFSQKDTNLSNWACQVRLAEYSTDYKKSDAKFPGGKDKLSSIFINLGTFEELAVSLPVYDFISVCVDIDTNGDVLEVHWPSFARASTVENLIPAFQNMAKWIPAKMDGVKRKSTVCIALVLAAMKTRNAEFKKMSYDITHSVEVMPPPAPPVPAFPHDYDHKEEIRREIVDFPDVDAIFPGGNSELTKFINEKMEYPKVAYENRDQGKVYLSFVVGANGVITGVQVDRGVSVELDKEAKRLIRSMPKWIPAESNGKKVATRCRLPIVFTLP